MVGILVSLGDGLFSGGMLVAWSVVDGIFCEAWFIRLGLSDNSSGPNTIYFPSIVIEMNWSFSYRPLSTTSLKTKMEP